MSKWFFIDGEDHTQIDSLQEGIELMNQSMKQNPNKLVRLLDQSQYRIWEGRKRKRGKNS